MPLFVNYKRMVTYVTARLSLHAPVGRSLGSEPIEGKHHAGTIQPSTYAFPLHHTLCLPH